MFRSERLEKYQEGRKINNGSLCPTPTTLDTVLRQAREALAQQGLPCPSLEARLLAGHGLGLTTTQVLTQGDRHLQAAEVHAIDHLLQQRLQGQPMAYLLGYREFWSLNLYVDAHCLIPRPETEAVVEQALRRLPPHPCRCLDAGTGSGAIALALRSERPDLELWAVDYSAAALAVAQANACALGLPVHYLRSNWLQAFAPRPLFALIASNPPYLDPDDPHRYQGDLRFEPDAALISAEQGWADLHTLLQQAWPRLLTGGWLILEHGYTQGPELRARLSRAGYQAVQSYADLAGHERITEAQRP